MREKLLAIAREIGALEERRKQLAAFLNSKKDVVLAEAFEKGLSRPVASRKVSASVAAVDGGLLSQEFHGFDLLLSRAVGVLFEYHEGVLSKHLFHPGKFPEPEPSAESSLDTHDMMLHKTLFRVKKEIACARECVAAWKPAFLFMDGSLVPQLNDKPGEESSLKELYKEVVGLLVALYSEAQAAGCEVVGVIKDSRGKRFMELLEKEAGEFRDTAACSSDTSFLQFLLEKGERTVCFPYSSGASKHKVLKDFGEFGSRISVFYVKPSKDDRPIRVEFLGGVEKAEKIAETVHSLSAINEKYSYPAVLIEADLRAALNPIELDRAYAELFTQSNSSFLKLRRDSRPFR